MTALLRVPTPTPPGQPAGRGGDRARRGGRYPRVIVANIPDAARCWRSSASRRPRGDQTVIDLCRATGTRRAVVATSSSCSDENAGGRAAGGPSQAQARAASSVTSAGRGRPSRGALLPPRTRGNDRRQGSRIEPERRVARLGFGAQTSRVRARPLDPRGARASGCPKWKALPVFSQRRDVVGGLRQRGEHVHAARASARWPSGS